MGDNNKVKFEDRPKVTLKESLGLFIKRMTTVSPTAYSQRIQTMTPTERSQAREALRSKIKWGSYSFVFIVISGFTLYSRYLGTDESRLRFNVKKYLVNEEREVANLRREVEELEAGKMSLESNNRRR